MIVGGAVAGAAFLAKHQASSGGLDFGRLIERMPDDAPPKWMFNNINAIRENTERILELLKDERASVEQE